MAASVWVLFIAFVLGILGGGNCANAGVLAIHDYETTRMKSTAGAGVASILMDEAAVLNPATLAFFNMSSVYFQKINAKFLGESEKIAASSSNDPTLGPEAKMASYGVIAVDAKSAIKGAASYQKQQEWYSERSRISATLSSLLGRYSGMGMIYRYTKENNSDNGRVSTHENYSQVVVGAVHAVDPGNFTVGVVFIDPLKQRKQDTRAIVGGQYLMSDVFSVMFDVGGDYNRKTNETFFYRGAIQINFFSDLYLRMGMFRDREKNEQGNGVGIGWISPRLMLELALKNTEFAYDAQLLQKASPQYAPKDLREVSFSLSYRF